MELHLLSIPFAGDYDEIAEKLHIDEDYADEFREVFDACMQIARPKGVFCECAVSQEGEYTSVGNQRFRSRVMRVNLEGCARAFPYVISCGRELYDYAQATADPLVRYWIDTISEFALREVGMRLHRDVLRLYGLKHINSMNPGSLADFPLSCQRPLFDLLGEGPDSIGLELTDTFLMLPYKAGSGIYYEAETSFENCSLCPRENCPNRRAKFSEKLFRETYGLHMG